MEEFNKICINRVYATIGALLDLKLTNKAEPIKEVCDLANIKFNGKTDRIFMYNPDAIASWIYDCHQDLFAPLLKEIDLNLNMLSVVPPVTPVCFASMYSGLMPQDHGIQKYVKPVLKCKTIFDDLVLNNKKIAIVSTENDSISMIFLNRPIDYYIYPTKQECNAKAKQLINEDKYDVIVLYNGDYDYYMHRFGPEGKRSLQALKENINTYLDLSSLIKEKWKNHHTVLAFAPDHGNHKVLLTLGNHGVNKPCDMNIHHFYKFI